MARVEETLSYSRQEIETVQIQFAALVKTPGAASSQIPLGF